MASICPARRRSAIRLAFWEERIPGSQTVPRTEKRTGLGQRRLWKWGSGDNLDTFNARYKIATDKGFSHDEALIEAARKTKTGEWARAAGFNKVNITKAEGPPVHLPTWKWRLLPTCSQQHRLRCAHRHGTICRVLYIPSQSGAPGSTFVTQMPPAK